MGGRDGWVPVSLSSSCRDHTQHACTIVVRGEHTTSAWLSWRPLHPGRVMTAPGHWRSQRMRENPQVVITPRYVLRPPPPSLSLACPGLPCFVFPPLSQNAPRTNPEIDQLFVCCRLPYNLPSSLAKLTDIFPTTWRPQGGFLEEQAVDCMLFAGQMTGKDCPQ